MRLTLRSRPVYCGGDGVRRSRNIVLFVISAETKRVKQVSEDDNARAHTNESSATLHALGQDTSVKRNEILGRTREIT